MYNTTTTPQASKSSVVGREYAQRDNDNNNNNSTHELYTVCWSRVSRVAGQNYNMVRKTGFGISTNETNKKNYPSAARNDMYTVNMFIKASVTCTAFDRSDDNIVTFRPIRRGISISSAIRL